MFAGKFRRNVPAKINCKHGVVAYQLGKNSTTSNAEAWHKINNWWTELFKERVCTGKGKGSQEMVW